MRTYKNSYTGKPTDPKNFYVDPKELADEIKKSQQQHQCTENLALMAQKVLKNVINWPKFRYLDVDMKEELQSYSMYRWLKTGLYSCNAEGNVFSYLTQSMYSNCLCKLLQIRKKQENQKKYKKQILDKLGKWYDNEISEDEEDELNL